MNSQISNSTSRTVAVRTAKQKIIDLLRPGSPALIILAFVIAIVSAVPINIHYQGQTPKELSSYAGIPGELWLRAIKASIIPLLFVCMSLAIYRLRNIEGAGGKLGLVLVCYFTVSTISGLVVGFAVGFMVLPVAITPLDPDQLEMLRDSANVEDDVDANADVQMSEQFVSLIHSFIPQNVFRSLSQDEMLSVIAVAIAVGAFSRLSSKGEKGSKFVDLLEDWEDLVTRIVTFIITLAPIGVLSLLFSTLVIVDVFSMFRLLTISILVKALGTTIQTVVVYPFMYFAITGKNPFPCLKGMVRPAMMGLATSSSAACLPVLLETAKRLGASDAVVKFVVPLGATINMDAGALSLPIAIIWLATAQNLELSTAQVLATALLSTIGTMGVQAMPNPTLAIILAMCKQMGLPVTGFTPLILAEDMISDRVDTVTNNLSNIWVTLIANEFVQIGPTALAPDEVRAIEMEQGYEMNL